ncbi:MAG TPA: hydrogenase maturation nickel metallochaperone HypA [Candidatus Lokiarchaeia archaeon]|nr:hydrogenase maturation nickel metallochaperone HypA [Candidatus Lokiarchaeia archaeon]
MHEFGFAQQIADICVASAEKNNALRIKDIYIEIGDFTLIQDEYLQFCFNIIADQTPILKGAEFHITHVPGVVRCQECGHDTVVTIDKENPLSGINIFACEACGATNTVIVRGKEANVKNLKIEV